MVVEYGGGDNVQQEVGGTGRCKSKGKKRERENVNTHTQCRMKVLRPMPTEER